jgi:hypothetical protein
VLAHAVAPGPGIAVGPGESIAVHVGLLERCVGLLALTARAAIHHDEPEATAIDPWELRLDEGNPVTVAPLPRCCHPAAFATARKSPTAQGYGERAREDSNL